MRLERIDDAADPRLADYRDVKDPDLRQRQGIFIAESREVVRQLLASRRFRTRSVLLTAAALAALRAHLEAVAPDVPIFLVEADLARRVIGYGFHRGCLAAAERGSEPPAAGLIDPAGPRVLVVLDGITDPDNIGVVFRNAMAFGADGILLSPAAADPLYRKAIRVSMGAALAVPFARLEGWPASLGRFREAGYAVIALRPRAPVDVAEFGASRPVPERLALVLGAEGHGLSAGARAAADWEVGIAMAPGADSLNVGTACGIALHRLCARGR
ncbi:MAG TPA: RNA methyltransferase [Candidatus Methylomirabilis sp.]|nr:RNA methyltransferase [Candidatus Methylomirabilis sp.]